MLSGDAYLNTKMRENLTCQKWKEHVSVQQTLRCFLKRFLQVPHEDICTFLSVIDRET